MGNERGFENVTSRADETFHKEKEQLPKRPPADDSHAGGGNERGIGNLSAWAASFYKEKEPLPNGPPGDDSIDVEYYRQDDEDYSPYPDEDTSTHTYAENERAKRQERAAAKVIAHHEHMKKLQERALRLAKEREARAAAQEAAAQRSSSENRTRGWYRNTNNAPDSSMHTTNKPNWGIKTFTGTNKPGWGTTKHTATEPKPGWGTTKHTTTEPVASNTTSTTSGRGCNDNSVEMTKTDDEKKGGNISCARKSNWGQYLATTNDKADCLFPPNLPISSYLNLETKEAATKDNPSHPEKGCNHNNNSIELTNTDDEEKEEDKKLPANPRTTRGRCSSGGKKGYSTPGVVTRSRSKEKEKEATPKVAEPSTEAGSKRTTEHSTVGTPEVAEPSTVACSKMTTDHSKVAEPTTEALSKRKTEHSTVVNAPPASKKRKTTTARKGPASTNTHEEEDDDSVTECEKMLPSGSIVTKYRPASTNTHEEEDDDSVTECEKMLPSGSIVTKYIETVRKEGHDHALRKIVYKSHEKQSFEGGICKSEIEFHMTMADFASKLTKAQYEPISALFGHVDQYINDILIEKGQYQKVLRTLYEQRVIPEDMEKQVTMIKQVAPWQTGLPTSKHYIRRAYIDGKRCINSSIPYVQAIRLDDDHAYVSLCECIQLMFLHEVPYFDHNNNNHHQRSDTNGSHSISHCRMAQERRSKNKSNTKLKIKSYIDIDLMEWSDDFEPLNSVKRGRGSIWVKVVTVVAPVDTKNCERNTFLIAVGKKGSDHSIVEQKFAEELRTLSCQGVTCYVPSLKKDKVVKGILLVSLQDQPERRSACGITAGNGRYTKRWGYAYDVTANQDKLPSCDCCFVEQLCDIPHGSINSNKISDSGEMDSMSNEMDTESAPESMCMDCYNWTFPKETKQEFVRLCNICKETCTDVANPNEKMTDQQLRERLEKHGISPAVVEKVMQPALLTQRLHVLQKKEKDLCDEEQVEYTQLSDLNAEFLRLYTGPVQWKRNMCIDQHVDAPMHLLFLGIVKSVTLWTTKWAKERKQTKQFGQFIGEMEKPLSDIKALNLSWVKTMLFSGNKLGGWISENYVAHGRILKWFYGWMDMATASEKSTDDAVVLEDDHSKWKVHTMRTWLRVRELLPIKNAKHADLKKQIQDEMDNPNGPREPVASRGIEPRFVRDMLEALQCMLSILMSPTESHHDESIIATSTRYIKIFLTLFGHCDKALHSGQGTDKYKWVASYNFLSLLNLPTVIHHFGCLRNLWEGGIHGEGSLRAIKPYAGQGMKEKNWHVNLINKVHQARNRKELMTRMSDNESMSDVVDAHREKIFVYKTEDEATDAFEKGKPLSVTYVAPSRFYMKVESPANTNVLLEIKSVLPHTKAGMTYFEFETRKEVVSGPEKLGGRVATLFLPVPKLSCMKENDWSYHGCYAVIDEDWKELDNSGKFNHPRPSTQMMQRTGSGTCFAQDSGLLYSILSEKWYGTGKHTNLHARLGDVNRTDNESEIPKRADDVAETYNSKSATDDPDTFQVFEDLSIFEEDDDSSLSE